jgi:NAD(P)-dependent dehydrogenase (short-subunit alcohol dehydrogenase family)
MELTGKVALVTGASQGTGRAYALALAKAGATVVATSRRMGAGQPGEAPKPASLAETVRLSEEMGSKVHAIACDVGDPDEIERTVDQVIGNFGRIDVVINNAATYPADQPIPHNDPFGFSAPEWDRYMRVNVIGPYFMIRAAAPYMIRQGSGSIINISSGAAGDTTYGSVAHYGMLAYGVTKAALDKLSRWYAAELGRHGIAVNSLYPGAVITNSWRGLTQDLKDQMLDTGMAKPPTVEALGDAIVFLARQTGAGVTGRILEADEFGTTWP